MQQYGFRAKHFTELAATRFVDHTSKRMDEHKPPGRIFIDLSKAFDTLSRDIFLRKLNVYDLSGVEHKMLLSYLSDRKQYVLVSSKKNQ